MKNETVNLNLFIEIRHGIEHSEVTYTEYILHMATTCVDYEAMRGVHVRYQFVR